MRPDIGTQRPFRKKKSPATWQYNSSLSPSLDWHGHHGAHEPEMAAGTAAAAGGKPC
jgi:hypothetical protein